MQTPQILDEQIQRHQGYLESDADNLPLRLKLGDLNHQAGRLEEALACYRQCLHQTPGYAPARGRVASVLITQHRFSDAEKALRELLAEGEADAALLHNLGLTLYFQERWDEARECFDQAAKAGLDQPSNFAYLARTFHHLGHMPEAIGAAQMWAGQAQDARSRGYLALLYLDNNEVESGRQLALQVLADDPDNPDANVVNGVALAERQEVAQARRHFETALRQEGDNGRAWLGLGLAYLYEGDHANAIEALGKAVRIYPNNSGFIVALGWAQLSAMDPAAAEQTFEQAVRVDRNFAESHGGLASALAMQKKIEQAQAEIQIARRLDRKSFGAEFAGGAILAIKGNQQAASAHFSRLFEQVPPHSVVPLIEQLRIYSAKKMPPRNPERPADAEKP